MAIMNFGGVEENVVTREEFPLEKAREVLKNDKDNIMLAYTYVKPGKFELQEKPKPGLKDSRDAIVRVTLGSICTSDLHIKHGSVPRAVPGVTVGHEMWEKML